MPISITTAALGGEIEIPTLDGYAKIKVPPETQTGKVFRLRGKGIKGVRQPPTATCCATSSWRRRSTSPRARASCCAELEAINQNDGGRHNPRAKSWMEKVREFFAQ